MWGADWRRIETVDEGWVWVFSAVDHFDACCVRIRAIKTGDRFAALQPIAQGLKSDFGATGASAERFNEMLKEQAIHGRVFKDLEEVRVTVAEFNNRYSRYWRLAKLRLMSLRDSRQAYAIREAA